MSGLKDLLLDFKDLWKGGDKRPGPTYELHQTCEEEDISGEAFVGAESAVLCLLHGVDISQEDEQVISPGVIGSGAKEEVIRSYMARKYRNQGYLTAEDMSSVLSVVCDKSHAISYSSFHNLERELLEELVSTSQAHNPRPRGQRCEGYEKA